MGLAPVKERQEVLWVELCLCRLELKNSLNVCQEMTGFGIQRSR